MPPLEWTGPLEEHQAALLAARRPGVELRCRPAPRGRFALGASRVGGLPDLPRSATWPTARRKKARTRATFVDLPLAFVAQIALADVAPHSDELPSSGLLSFFTLDELRLAEVGWTPESSRARDRTSVHFTPSRATLVRRTPPPGLPESRLFPSSRPRFRTVETWPQVEGTVIGDHGARSPHGGIQMDEAAWEAWAEHGPENVGAQMLGHPFGCEFPIGSDPTARLLLSLDARSGIPQELCGRNGFLFVGIPGAALARRTWGEAYHKEW